MTALCVCAPVTCGVAMLVPLMVLVAPVLPIHDDVMPDPGAKISKPAAFAANETNISPRPTTSD